MLTLEKTQAVPHSLRTDGTIHVTGSRVTLDSVIGLYRAGQSGGEIQRSFPTLSLAQIYGVLHYYHGHQEEVEAYLQQRPQQAEQLRRKIEADSWLRPLASALP